MSMLEEQLRSTLAARAEAVTESMLTRTVPVLEAEPDSAPVLLLPPHRPHRSRRLVATALAVAAVLLVAFGAVALHRATSHRVEPAHVRPRSAIPWNQVGPGWTLVQVTPKVVLNGHHLVGDEQVELVDPSETRYQISSVTDSWFLVNWDGQHRHAIFFGGTIDPSGSEHYQSERFMVMDLLDGSQHAFTVPAPAQWLRFSRDGRSVIYVDVLHRVERYSLTGQPQQPRQQIPSSGMVADSPDGRQAIVDGRGGLDVYDFASGQRVGNLAPPKGYAGCYDPQWGADGKLVATCLQGADRTKVGRFVFSAGGVPAAGRPDPQYAGPVDHRVTGFRQGAVATRYLINDANPAPDSFPSLTHLTASRVDAAGHTVSIPVPAQLRNSQWMIASSTPDAFTVVRYSASDSNLYTAAVSWNPFTGQVTELIHAATPTEVFTALMPWDAQQY
jgi:hypothetical protein